AVRLAAVRGGRMVGESDFFASRLAEGAGVADLIGAFVGQHYGRHRPPPRVVIMQCGLSAAALAAQIEGRAPGFIVAPRGGERERVQLCCANAAAALAERDGGREMQQLAGRIGIAQIGRFDCFDVSHSMGEKAVASCVVCIDGKMEKRLYRRMRLAAERGGDDCAGIREAVARRYRQAERQAATLPDLVVVDGGAGQVGAAVEALADAAFSCRVLGIAKGPGRRPGCEKLICDDGQIIDLAPTDRAFRMLQNARDEAHRFALAYHRKRRDRSRRSSLLDDVEGVGPKLRRAILNEFGGLHGLRKAGPGDLTRIKGVGTELARRIYLALHP
ncbi:MAG: helix-hairpin-helix domain-containing protein, partial [Betaproteobacteria bacterium]|nr:helix-hairpin-helix domain-containing protein [Betaproteobacteria bacterium]